MCKWNEERRCKPFAICDDKSKPKHNGGGTKRKHDERIENFFEFGRFGEGKGGRETEEEGYDHGRGCIGERIENRFYGRDIEYRTATIDEEFFVVIGSKPVLDFVTLSTVGFEAKEGAGWKGGKREKEEGEKQKAEDGDKEFLFEGGRFNSCVTRVKLLRIAHCVFCVKEGEDEGTEELDDGEEGGEGQVEEFYSLEVNFHFEGGVLGIAEEEDHTKGGEIKEEDEERGGEDGGTKERQGYVFPNLKCICAERAGGLFEFGIEAGEGCPYDADDDGGIVENVG